jgi:hypothetical protein
MFKFKKVSSRMMSLMAMVDPSNFSMMDTHHITQDFGIKVTNKAGVNMSCKMVLFMKHTSSGMIHMSTQVTLVLLKVPAITTLSQEK